LIADITPCAGSLRRPIKVRAELVVSVADDELRPRPEGSDVAELLRGPALGRSPGHRQVDDLLRVHVDHEEREEGAEPDVVDLQEVTRPNGVVAQEGPPPLAVARRTHAAEVALDGALGDPDAQLQEFPADALRAPEPILGGHPC
jgi:hypothetical protein